MKTKYILPLNTDTADLNTVGGKGASLTRLIKTELPVPAGFHITTAAYHRFIAVNDLQPAINQLMQGLNPQDPKQLEIVSSKIMGLLKSSEIPGDIAEEIKWAYSRFDEDSPAVAVRSSATAEDLPEASFAGQQETFLNCIGPEDVLAATRKCWAALWTARAIAYRARQGISTEGIGLAVILQLMIPADSSGILFTANPVTGVRHEAVINASWGLGEAIVGGQVTPDTITIDKLKFRIVSTEIAKKHLQTISKEKGTAEAPVPEDKQNKPVLSNMQARELTIMGNKIERLYGMPMDIEWAHANGNFYILQARPITAMPEPEPDLFEDWDQPESKAQYMRVSICELLPEPVSPLFNTLGLNAINRGIGRMVHEMFKLDLNFLDDFVVTVHGYAYEKINFTARQWFVMLAKMVPAFPRMLREGVPFWQEKALPEYIYATEKWNTHNFDKLPARELYDGVTELMDAFGFHLGALMASTMGPTAGSEGVFTNIYKRFAKQEGDPEAPTFLMGFENAPMKSEKALYDIAEWCRTEPQLAKYILEKPAEELHSGHRPDPFELDSALWQMWLKNLDEYLQQHGYAIYDMDFAKPLPMDHPEPILEVLKGYLSGQIQSPYERHQSFEDRRLEAEERVRPRLRGIKKWAFEKSLNWAQKQAPLREDGLAEIGHAYPVIRSMLDVIGQRLANAEVIHNPEDIYWLEEKELDEVVDKIDTEQVYINGYHGKISRRKAIWQAQKRSSPPAKINMGDKYMGFDTSSFLHSDDIDPKDHVIKGVATSPGEVTGVARVLHGPEDFDKMEFGEILVAGITTPAWTPLFAMAAAVVTDIGGPLSHGSIVAREYGIPAVLGTGVATRRIRSGQVITVDGNRGTVTMVVEKVK